MLDAEPRRDGHICRARCRPRLREPQLGDASRLTRRLPRRRQGPVAMRTPLLGFGPRATRDVLVAALLVALAVLPAPARTAASAAPKVVIVVGPSGPSYNRVYRSEANLVYQEVRRYTSNVVRVSTPYATWAKVKAAAAGASILVYFGHGNGYPSVYGAFHGDTKNGMGLDPTRGANGTRHRNYGEDYVRTLSLAPNAAVLLYRLCYADGHTEPGMSE